MHLRPYSFSLTVLDEFELRLKLSGCRGAEYYDKTQNLLDRLREFELMKLDLYVRVHFTADDSETGFYLADDKQQEHWISILEEYCTVRIEPDVANKRTSGGITYYPAFFVERDHDMVGFRPVSLSRIETELPYELSKGFDITKSKSLYQ